MQNLDAINPFDEADAREAAACQPSQEGFNGLSGRDWALLSKNVWDDVSSPRESYHLEHGATFPLALAERVVKLYSRKNDLVFDPFAGVGTTVTAAARLERDAIGIELQRRFCDIANRVLDKEKTDLFGQRRSRHAIVCADCRDMFKYVDKGSVQLTLTSPPYANFAKRSLKDRARASRKSVLAIDNNSTLKAVSLLPEDLGNCGYDQFLVELKSILKKVAEVTRPGGYSVWVMKDYRDTQNNIPYVPVHTHVMKLGVEAGWQHHDLIIWDQNDQRRLVSLGFPSVFYSNQNCSFLIVFRKA